MNTRLIENTKVKELPYFPNLAADRTNRIITKHFTNIILVLEPDAAALLTWLIYQCDKRNTFVYSTHLVNKYLESVKQARVVYNGIYGPKNTVGVAPIKVRYALKGLIEQGLIWPVEGKRYMVSPALSFNPNYCSRRQWQAFINDMDCKSKIISNSIFISFYTNEYRNLKP